MIILEDLFKVYIGSLDIQSSRILVLGQHLRHINRGTQLPRNNTSGTC